MNVSKFIITVLTTALYTSAIWAQCLHPLGGGRESMVLTTASFLVLVFGGVPLLVMAGCWIVANWNK